MRRIALAAAMAALLAAGPVRAFDASGADIIGLRLGMPETEVLARLGRQGYVPKQTPGAIEASTLDGRLQIVLSADRGVTEIRYIITGRRRGDPVEVQASIIFRFGAPNQASPPGWCRAVGRDGMCPPDQASLTYLPETLTMLLRAQAPGQP